jgi:hypothetical protein
MSHRQRRVYVRQFSITRELIGSVAILAWTLVSFPLKLLLILVSAPFAGAQRGYQRNLPRRRLRDN